MIQAASPLVDAERSISANRLVWLSIAVVAAGYFLVEHDVHISQRVEIGYANASDALEKSAESGNWTSKAGYSLLGVFGVACLACGARREFAPRGIVPFCLIAATLWLFGSVLWSADPFRTTKNIAIISFVLLAACGLARQLTSRQLVAVVWGVSAGFLLLGVGSELVLGTFQPWSGEYRFAGTLHPNGAGPNCVLCALTSFLLFCESRGNRRHVLLLLLMAFAVTLLYLTRSRSTFATFVLALSTLVALRLPISKSALIGFFGFWSVSATLLVTTAANVPLAEKLAGVFLMGRTTSLDSLNGRAELWDLAFDHIDERPVTGYGYAGFWREDIIAKFTAYTGWSMNSAHSLYIDCALGLGYVGLGLLVLVLIVSGCFAGWRFMRRGDPAAGLATAVILFGSVTGLTESSFFLPSFMTFIAVASVFSLALYRTKMTAALSAALSSEPFLMGTGVAGRPLVRPKMAWKE